MKITVLAGSPKGKTSVTMQYVHYLAQLLGEHQVTIQQISNRIKAFESNPSKFDQVIDEVRTADLVLWACPVYVALVPAGFKRFIELVAERGVQDAFAGKHAASLTTSIHFHDNTAHDYLQAVSEDLGMRFGGSFSPEMHDLEKEEGQHLLEAFVHGLAELVELDEPAQRTFAPLPDQTWDYLPGEVEEPIDPAGKRVVILHDSGPEAGNVPAMVERLQATLGGQVEAIDLNQVDIKGSCLGCLRCAQAYRCAYEGKDGYIDFYNQKVKTADILIFVGAVRDRHLSARWRMYFDRSFFNTHTPTLQGKQLAVVVSGPLSHMPNLREVMNSYAQWQELNLTGFVSDEGADDTQLDGLLTALVRKLVANAKRGYVAPADFVGVGGHKIFRDEIFGKLRWVFQADHRFFKQNGKYDFPTRDLSQRALGATMGFLFKIPKVRSEFEKEIKKGMIRKLEEVVDEARITSNGKAAQAVRA